MRNKIIDFECPRCTYSTRYSTDMHRHLYNRKKICPNVKEDLELTDEIKQIIMEKRKYIPKPTEPVPCVQNIFNQHINTMNNVFNYVNTLCHDINDVNKFIKYTNYLNTDVLCLDDSIDTIFQKQVVMLTNDTFSEPLQMNHDDLYRGVEHITTLEDTSNYSDMNIILDNKDGVLYILDDDYEWKNFRFEEGVKIVVGKLQDNYLHSYERYLINKMKLTSGFVQQQLKEWLIEYYHFIACFDLMPLSKERDDVVFDNTYMRTFDVSNEIYPLYTKTKDTMKRTSMNKTIKTVTDIIRRNCCKNLKHFYVKLYDMICKDESFKQNLGITIQGKLPMIFLKR